MKELQSELDIMIVSLLKTHEEFLKQFTCIIGINNSYEKQIPEEKQKIYSKLSQKILY